ncbi:cytochrome P450 [Pseudomassariella vexata]|uniref:Cytochrome P450 n=1 Tax=Pseudomassariella vexata TaxID=1141098 RepID=A0A1Y2E761_9PEZI|nr:cytochrome P450 [Pseudomassariella vexata]ORY67380.1 cytochrome P450 [Pseudomassariella vexata]
MEVVVANIWALAASYFCYLLLSFMTSQSAAARDQTLHSTKPSLLSLLSTGPWNLALDPLSAFNGFLALAFISWDLFGHGSYHRQIMKMHDEYGPIVRVNPNELVVQDAEFFQTLYVAGGVGDVRRTQLRPGLGNGNDMDRAHPYTVGHDSHRRRRRPLEPFFSWLGVSQHHPLLSEMAATLVKRLEDKRETKSVVRLDHAFFAFAGDFVTRICFKNPAWSFLEEPDFGPGWYELLTTMVRFSLVLQNFGWIAKMPQWILKRHLEMFYPPVRYLREWKDMSLASVTEEMRITQSQKSLAHRENHAKPNSLFERLFNSDLPASVLTIDRIVNEAHILLLTETMFVARSMDHLVFQILSNPEIHNRLSEELRNAMAEHPREPPSVHRLQQLPYLQSCIKEGLRLSISTLHTRPRVSPDVELHYKEWVIPRGTAVGMHIYSMHMDPEVYPEPATFQPARWLGDIDPRMARNWVPFMKGSHGCLDSSLALAEISIVIYALFGPKGPKLKLYETDASDVRRVHGFVGSRPRMQSNGVRVTVE